MGFLQEFKEFAAKGNVVDMAVGIVIGSAFGKIITSLVEDIIMPAVSLVTGGVNFTDMKIVLSAGNPAAGIDPVTLNYGNFIQNIVDFLIIALCIFMVVKFMNKLKKQGEAKEEGIPALSNEEQLLTEIRDLLKEK